MHNLLKSITAPKAKSQRDGTKKLQNEKKKVTKK